ncbi:MAG: hypothetical protein IBX69_02895 [Anaerolineales bacterium]|nr:hypothetical protein [Anaerolineales bacterium]
MENDHFLIYDIEPKTNQYGFIKKAATPMLVPQGVRAAFQLESYHGRMACVVTGEVFDEEDGYVTIFHEFIHCQQSELCEQELKQKLEIARKAQAANDIMWEINHPFPYTTADFVEIYQAFLATHELPEIERIRHKLNAILNPEDYEYMVWQEWKEGFARFIENQIRNRLGLPENHRGREQPFNRVVFYAGGDHYIKVLSMHEIDLIIQIETLFDRMFAG